MSPLLRTLPPSLLALAAALVLLGWGASDARSADDDPECLPGTILLQGTEAFAGLGCVAVDERGARRADRKGRPLRHGTWEQRWPDGSRRSRCTFSEGVREGPCIFWRRWGGQVGRLDYKRGRPHGQLVRFGPRQKVVLEMSFRDGLPHGAAVQKDDRGTVLVEGEFRGGARQGPWSFRYPSGTLRLRGSFAGDKPTGAWSCVSPDALPGEVTFSRSLMSLDELADPAEWLQERGRLLPPARCSVDDPVQRCAEAEAGPDKVQHCLQAVEDGTEDPERWEALAAAEQEQRRFGPAAEAWVHSAELRSAEDPAAGASARAKAGAAALAGNYKAWAGELLRAALEADAGLLDRVDWLANALKQVDSDGPVRSGSGIQGSGFLVVDSVHVATNAHVVSGCVDVTVRRGEVEVAGKVLLADSELDLAVVELDSELGAPLALRVDKVVELGERVAVMGYPLAGILGDAEARLTEGIVNATRGPGGEERLLQMSAQIAPGNSGGPVLDATGAVVGVVVSTLDSRAVLRRSGALAQDINFAIRAPVLAGFLESSGLAWSSVRHRPASGLTAVAARAREATVLVRCVAPGGVLGGLGVPPESPASP